MAHSNITEGQSWSNGKPSHLRPNIINKIKTLRIVAVQSRVAGRYGLRSGVKAKWFPGLGVRAVRLES